ncbi:holo-ACP synthase [Caldisericum exile]|uniref:Holo-[acyl-carrier-protein] synthase n=1 Tax=Caldisericum exile (strain DSM 21853 / NBRC 104410 / AZM16c01) TaxID=511051 RepID=A0A7U6JFW7_CALEA|nr:holo-ACP synthase [Caldisericum exile]BAL80690.1 holo-[acyl-carrier-protein] synthase [Caldisericum exile AZM16c01]
MVKGVGIDIVSVKRIEKILNTYGYRFIKRILSDSELKELEKKGNTAEFLAGRFAVKEAITKTLDKATPFNQIEIIYNENSKPMVRNFPDIFISISHEKDFAIAVAIRVKI